jgi:hypothetical protein
VNAANLLFAVRPDGIIVKPDVPAVPTDESILNDAHASGEPLVSYTYTDHGPMRALYIFAHPRTDDRTFTFTPEKLGLTGKVYVYNWLADRGRRIDGDEPWTQTIHGDPSYLVAVPVGKSGIAFLGDAGKFVPLGKKRVSELTDDGIINATLEFAKTEHSIIVHGWAPSIPLVIAAEGRVGKLHFDEATGRFHVEVFRAKSGTAHISASLATPDDAGTFDRDN